MSIRAARIIASLDMLAEQEHAHRPGRDYLGASVIGHACDAYCAMDMRGWPTRKKAATIRAGKLGHVIEAMLIAELKDVGLEVTTVDPATGQQFEYTSHDGRFRCHLDGLIVISGETYVLELKSAKHSRFLKMKGKNLRESDRLYYDQVTTAMGMSEVHQAVFIVRDKDTGETHCEIVALDPFHWSYVTTKIDRILNGDCQKISNTPDYWRCKQCDRAIWCWGKGPPPGCGSWIPQERTDARS